LRGKGVRSKPVLRGKGARSKPVLCGKGALKTCIALQRGALPFGRAAVAVASAGYHNNILTAGRRFRQPLVVCSALSVVNGRHSVSMPRKTRSCSKKKEQQARSKTSNEKKSHCMKTTAMKNRFLGF